LNRVLILTDPSHQFKVRRNTEQLNLTGVCIFHPSFNLVYVEGAAKFMKNFKRLMLHRIAWTEQARSRGGVEDVELEDPNSDAEGGDAERKTADVATALGKGKARDTGEGEKSLEDNKCFLIWEGALRDREYNSFRAKSCPTDREAKVLLGEKLKGYWDVAKNWKPEEEELF
jgi:U4/U6 small nuclear ribonucleoprotein PRP3